MLIETFVNGLLLAHHPPLLHVAAKGFLSQGYCLLRSNIPYLFCQALTTQHIPSVPYCAAQYIRSNADKFVQEVYASLHAGDTITLQANETAVLPDIKNELKALYPVLQAYALQPVIMINADTAGTDTVLLFIGKFGRPLPNENKPN